MFGKKDITTIIKETQEANAGELKRVLGPVQLISLGIGCIIGAGIFVMTGSAAAQYAGPALVLSFILGAIACGLAGLCYAELASVIPISGSAYTYAYATMGELIAWIVGWCLLLEYGIAASTVAVGWSGYFVSFLKDFGVIIPPAFTAPWGSAVTMEDGSTVTGIFNAPAAIAVLLVTAFLMRGIKESANLNAAMVIIKLVVIVLFIGVGVFYINTDNWVPFIPENQGGSSYGFQGIVTGAGVIFFAYIGFDAVSTAAQEARNPQKDMPIGILGSLLICTILYMLVSAILTGVVHYTDLNVPDPMAVAVNAMNLPWFAFIVKIGALTGLFSVMLVCTYSQIRINYVMAKDGLLPKIFAKVHPKYQTPHYNTWLCGGLIAAFAGLAELSTLGHLVSFGTLTAFTIVCAGVLYLRKSQPELHRPFRCPLVPWVPIGGMLACLYLIFGLPGETFRNFTIWLAAGIAIYMLYSRRHSHLNKPAA